MGGVCPLTIRQGDPQLGEAYLWPLPDGLISLSQLRPAWSKGSSVAIPPLCFFMGHRQSFCLESPFTLIDEIQDPAEKLPPL